MKKAIALFLSAFSVSTFSTELICASDFEVFGALIREGSIGGGARLILGIGY